MGHTNGSGKNYIRQVIVIKCFLVLLFFGCKTTQNISKNIDLCTFNDKTKNNFFVLDTTLFKGKKLSYSSKVLEDNDTLQLRFRKGKYFNLTSLDKKSNIETWYYYDKSDLKLRQVVYGYFLNNFLEIGEEKYFDKKGNIIKTVDYRQKDKYPLCYKQALKLVENWKPKDYEINHISRDSIVNNKGITYTWMVHVRHPVKARNEAKMYLYTIDAKTGKKLKKVETLLGTNDDL